MTPRIFTYGTLQPGERYWPEIQRWVLRHRPASVRGFELWSFPQRGYPAIVPAEPGAHTAPVQGTLLTFEEATFAEALGRCDEIEGLAQGLYQRILYDDAEVTCHLYVYAPQRLLELHDHAVRVPQGRWLQSPSD